MSHTEKALDVWQQPNFTSMLTKFLFSVEIAWKTLAWLSAHESSQETAEHLDLAWALLASLELNLSFVEGGK